MLPTLLNNYYVHVARGEERLSTTAIDKMKQQKGQYLGKHVVLIYSPESAFSSLFPLIDIR